MTLIRSQATLIRYESTSEGTFGLLTLDDLELHTIERPWLNNKPFESCIPSGDYALHPFTRNNGDTVLALIGETVSITQDPNYDRYAILIHSGNYMTDVVGCIAPGMARSGHRVISSRKAMNLIMDKMPDFLTIEWNTI